MPVRADIRGVMQRSHLSRESFERIVAALKVQKAGGLDKRTASRAGMRSRVTVLAWDGQTAGEPEEAWCRDISPAGLGLVTRRAFKPRQQFLLRLPGEDENLFLIYAVTRISQAADRLYNVGATLRGTWGGTETDLKIRRSRPRGAVAVRSGSEIERIRSAILE